MGMKLRRNQNYLVIIGVGVVVLGIWSVIKTVLLLLVNPELVSENLQLVDSKALSLAQTIVVVFLLLGAELCIRLYVGLCAQREAFGQYQGNLYVVLAGILTLYRVVLFFLGIATGFRYYHGLLDGVCSLLTDLISFVTLLELINSVAKVRWYTAKLAEME